MLVLRTTTNLGPHFQPCGGSKDDEVPPASTEGAPAQEDKQAQAKRKAERHAGTAAPPGSGAGAPRSAERVRGSEAAGALLEGSSRVFGSEVQWGSPGPVGTQETRPAGPPSSQGDVETAIPPTRQAELTWDQYLARVPGGGVGVLRQADCPGATVSGPLPRARGEAWPCHRLAGPTVLLGEGAGHSPSGPHSCHAGCHASACLPRSFHAEVWAQPCVTSIAPQNPEGGNPSFLVLSEASVSAASNPSITMTAEIRSPRGRASDQRERTGPSIFRADPCITDPPKLPKPCVSGGVTLPYMGTQAPRGDLTVGSKAWIGTQVGGSRDRGLLVILPPQLSARDGLSTAHSL